MKKLLALSIALLSVSSAFAAGTTTKTSSKTITTTTEVIPAKTVQTVSTSQSSGEDYKSYHPSNQFTFGAAGGFGLIDTHGGASIIGSVATKIVKDGFVPDIVNPVFLELQFGPTFTSGATFWQYSTHLRWDFVKDANWTLFAIGGFGGNIADNKWGDRVALHPRFGVGAFYALEAIDLRFDFSHELITAGVSLPF